MKQCPNCQKVFEDDKKFCQIDGTSLLDMVTAPPDDPFKTVVGGPPITVSNVSDDNMKTFVMSKEDKEDILQIPEAFDAMKTMVISEPIKPPTPPSPVSVPVVSAPEPPKFSEPSLSPPTFGDLSASEPVKIEEPPKFESPFSTPVVEAPKIEPPIANPFSPPMVETPKFESTPLPSVSSGNDSPFNKPVNAPIPSPFDAPLPPPLKEPAPMFSNEPKPMSSPFDQPVASPFGQANDPFANQQQNSAWTPPPAPVQSWQDQSVGANTPFQPPVAGSGGQNQTMAIVSLVCGILSCLCCFSIITGPVALIVGFLAKGNISKDPSQYGGAGLALGGMITGAIGTLIGIAFIVLQLLGAFAGRF